MPGEALWSSNNPFMTTCALERHCHRDRACSSANWGCGIASSKKGMRRHPPFYLRGGKTTCTRTTSFSILTDMDGILTAGALIRCSPWFRRRRAQAFDGGREGPHVYHDLQA